MDSRVRVLADCDAGGGTQAVAARHSVSEAWVRRETGRVAPARYRRGQPPAWVRLADRIREAVRAAPDLTLAECRGRFALPVAVPTPARAMAALGLSRERRRPARPSGTGRT